MYLVDLESNQHVDRELYIRFQIRNYLALLFPSKLHNHRDQFLYKNGHRALELYAVFQEKVFGKVVFLNADFLAKDQERKNRLHPVQTHQI